MGNMTTYGDISPRTGEKAVARLLKRGQYGLVTERFGMMDPQGKNQTKTRKWRRYNSLPRATAPLAEGIPPAGSKLTYTDITAVLEQYGDKVEITDVIADTHEDPVLNQALDLIAEQSSETIEELRINFLKAGTNAFYASTATTRGTVNSPPTRGDFRLIYRSFMKNKAKQISKIIRATAMVSTEPVASAYFAMGHTDLDADIRGLPGFIPAEQYSSSIKMLPWEIGKIDQFRIILTAMFDPWTAAGTSGTTYLSSGVAPGSSLACDVYPLIFVARDSYAIVPLQGHNAIVPMVLNPNKPSKSDALGQLGFVSWKTYQTGAILNEQWCARLECGATATPS